ncbi:MAG: Uma2 family endonuclease [Planctomycetota bacterium]
MATLTATPPPPTVQPTLTDEEIERRLNDDVRLEYIDGDFVEKPSMGAESAEVEVNVAAALFGLKKLGFAVYAQSLSYRCFPDSRRDLRRPDVSIMRLARLEKAGVARDARVMTVPADIAVEVVSANDRFVGIREKVQDDLAAGFGAVWVLAPDTKTLDIYTGDGLGRTLGLGDTLDGGELLDGFTVAVADFFEEDA